MPGIRGDAVRGHAAAPAGPSTRCAQECRDLGNDVAVIGRALHRAGLALHVHQAHAAVRMRGDGLERAGRAAAPRCR